MTKENKRHLILSIVLIIFLVIYFMTGCVNTRNYHKKFIEKCYGTQENR